MDSQTYQKPGQSRFFLSQLLGNGEILMEFVTFVWISRLGILVTEGSKHREQVRIAAILLLLSSLILVPYSERSWSVD